jgi:hypothetical protein
VGCAFDANGNSVGVWWGNGAPTSSAASVLVMAPSATRAAPARPFNYGYGPSASFVTRLGVHTGSPAAMRILRFGTAR